MQNETPWQEPADNEFDCYAIYMNLPESQRRFTVLHWRKGPNGYETDENALQADTLMGARKGLHETVRRELFQGERDESDVPELIEVWL